MKRKKNLNLRNKVFNGSKFYVVSTGKFDDNLIIITILYCSFYRIAGWDVKKYPRLYDKFHIGDQLLSVNDVQITDITFANKIIKHIKADFIELTIRRLPNASAFAIQRSMEGENIGIKREGGTGEVSLEISPIN